MSSHHRSRPGAGSERRSAHREEETPTSSLLKEYFIKGEGLNREVLQSEICRFLGNEATLRVGEHEGMRGYYVKAYRPFTPAMLKDLREKSAGFEAEKISAGRRRDGREALAYGDSQTQAQRYEQESAYGGPGGYGPTTTPYGSESYPGSSGYGPPPVHSGYGPTGYDSGPHGGVAYPQGYPLGPGQPGAHPSAEPPYQPNMPRNPGGQASSPYGYPPPGPSGVPYNMPPGQQEYSGGTFNMGGHSDQPGQYIYPPDPRGQSTRGGRSAMPGPTASPGADPYNQSQTFARPNPNSYEQPSRGNYAGARHDPYPPRGRDGGRR